MSTPRTDLAVESAAPFLANLPDGIAMEEETKNGIRITRVEIKTAKASKILDRPQGRYITVELPSPDKGVANSDDVTHILAEALLPLLPREGSVLVVGLGNDRMTPDALGPRTARNILATRHLPPDFAQSTGLSGLRSVAALVPGVLAQTGVESCELVAAVVKDIQPVAVIAVDAMAARAYERLGCTIQISDSGIAPGAGVQNVRKELSLETLGIPVISVGIPTVVDGGTLACELLELEDDTAIPPGARQLTVTPRDIDAIIDRGAKHLSLAINAALQPGLTLEEIDYLIS